MLDENLHCVGDISRKILAHGLGDRLLITSVISSSVSGGRGGGLPAGIGGLEGEEAIGLFLVAIIHVK